MRGGRWPIIVLVALALPALFWRLGAGPIDRSMEGREALVIQEIVRSGDWVLPRRNGEDVPHKPPFMHWIGATVAAARGGVVDETTVRLPSALAALASLLLVYGLAAREHGARHGLATALVLLTTESFTRQAREGWVDATLSAAILGALACFWTMSGRDRFGGPLRLAFHAALGIAFLSKGPIGVAVPGVALAAFLWATGRLRVLRALVAPAGIAVLAAVVLPWYLAAVADGGMLFFRTHVLTENLQRLVQGPEGSKPPWFFVPALLVEASPWGAALPFALWAARRTWRTPTLETYALAWFVAPFVLFSAAAGKRPVYLLPLMPAIAILVTGWIARLPPWRPWRPASAWGAAAATTAAVLGALLLLAGAAAGWWSDERLVSWLGARFQRHTLLPLRAAFAHHGGAAAAGVLGLAAAAGALVLALGRGQPRAVLAALLALALCWVAILKPLRLEHHRRARGLDRFAAAVRAATGEAPIAYLGTGEIPHLFFYLDRHVPRARCPGGAAGCPPGFYVVDARAWPRIRRRAAGRARLVLESRALREKPAGTNYLLVELRGAGTA